ncbi:hypothetical protein K4L44_05540 [Halosquirtibacter laminarini]|uniref:Uncharacterized protein n=1 Tax=Halosquirtibacter laminarini TaxID=3374600 RepID=A0AC61NQ72_9BACT|nr:hypothetical protein K4L44_05540 [Prolixibacteraceae bacterium]
MTNFRIIVSSILSFFALYSCSPSKSIENHKDKDLVVISKKRDTTFFVSHIYSDTKLGELFYKNKEGDLIQVSHEKQSISSILFDK